MLPSTMRAVLLTGYGGLDRLEYREDAPMPLPGPGEVLIRVGACGINNTDLNLRTRWYDRAVQTALTPEIAAAGAGAGGGASWKSEAVRFPRIQGAAVAGRVAAVGQGVAASRIGERVLIDPQIRDDSLPLRAQLVAYLGGDRDGGFVEYVVVPAANAHAVHSGLSDAELASFPTSYDTAEEMLARTRLAKGETVIVTGAAGGVGSALVQLARVRGARVVAIAGASKLGRLRDLGADATLAREAPDLDDQLRAAVGEGAEVAVDVVGGALFGPIIAALARGGRYASAGAIGGPVQPFDLRDLIYKDLEMYGITCPTRDTFARVVRLVEEGRLKPLVERVYPLSDLAQAQADLAARSHFGKFVVQP